MARAHMVENLLATGSFRRPVVAALARLRRERFVPHFWTTSPSYRGQDRDPMTEYFVGDPPDPAALEILYDIERAHAVNRVDSAGGSATSTASAPTVLAGQADALWLEPGMTVLEIGTGIGYFAALLTELVGPEGRVASIEIDPNVAAMARERLDAEGYSRVEVVIGDGHSALDGLGQFDRIVGSVGCTDISRAWLDHLSPGGFALVPLLHGGTHPMLRVDAQSRGRVVMRSGYVRIQGVQDTSELWPFARQRLETEESNDLPLGILDMLTIEPGRERIGGRRECDLAFWLAISDARAGRSLISLAGGDGSGAVIHGGEGKVEWGGPDGPALRDALLDHAQRWLEAGAPRLEDYEHEFVPRADPATEPIPNQRWVLTRLDHRQVIELRGRVMGTHLLVTRGLGPISQTVTGFAVALFRPVSALLVTAAGIALVTIAVMASSPGCAIAEPKENRLHPGSPAAQRTARSPRHESRARNSPG